MELGRKDVSLFVNRLNESGSDRRSSKEAETGFIVSGTAFTVVVVRPPSRCSFVSVVMATQNIKHRQG